jgi:hypothetical protein
MAIVQQLNCVPVASAKSSGLSGLLPVTYGCTNGMPIPKPKGMGCGCMGLGCTCGMGGLTMDGTGLFGTGVFGDQVTLTDLSTWTWAEYATVGLTGYVLFAVFMSTKQVAGTVRKKMRRKLR